jgi:hypothetical protein
MITEDGVDEIVWPLPESGWGALGYDEAADRAAREGKMTAAGTIRAQRLGGRDLPAERSCR